MNFEELLDRPPIETDPQSGRAGVEGKVVLVTGAGGSIGSALSKMILRCDPARLILLDSSEHNLYRLWLEVQEVPGAKAARFMLGDVSCGSTLEEILLGNPPEVVFHTAAFKHVPLLELHPLSAIRNNVLGTRTLVRKLIQSTTHRLVMISTDKSVRPHSIMGASKRIAELILLGLPDPGMRATSIRLGNVLGSRGSVVVRFREQIEAGRPLTVTHPEATRYFLSTDEAARLILAAVGLGVGHDILVPDLGRPVPILEIAKRLLRAACLPPDHAPAITFTGLRPGEKLSEELVAEGERTVATDHPAVRRIVAPLPSGSEVEQRLEELEALVAKRDAAAVVECVRRILPEYQPSERLLVQARRELMA